MSYLTNRRRMMLRMSPIANWYHGQNWDILKKDGIFYCLTNVSLDIYTHTVNHTLLSKLMPLVDLTLRWLRLSNQNSG